MTDEIQAGNTQPPTSFDELMNKINQTTNPRDMAFKTMSENIWKPQMLKQMARFDKSQILEIIKNYIVILLYEKYWSEIQVHVSTVKTGIYPYYKIVKDTQINIIDLETFLRTSPHARIIQDITELYIGEGGKARAEVFDFITAQARVMEEMRERNKQIQ